jgi:NEDD4-binding protein 2
MATLKMVGMRGMPGSGKSTKGKVIRDEHLALGFKVKVFSTDDFWGDPYNFVPAKIREAHLWNQHRAMVGMIDAWADLGSDHLLIIDNTNVQAWELRPYFAPAMKLGFECEIVEPGTAWAFNAEECAKRTVHGVPVETIRGMLARWDHNLTPEQCLKALAPWERSGSHRTPE